MLNTLKCYLDQVLKVPATFVGDGISTLKFSIDGLNYFAFYNKEEDPTYFRLMLPRVEIIQDQPTQDILNKCINISNEFKVGKAIILDNAVWLSAEIFLPENYNGISLFIRMISLLKEMLNKYRRSNE